MKNNTDNNYIKGLWHGSLIAVIVVGIPMILLCISLYNSIKYFNKYTEHYNFEQIETDYSQKEALEKQFELLINSGIKYDYFGFRSEEECNAIAAKAIMMMLDDDYAAYYTPKEAEDIVYDSLGAYKGIGITISLEPSSNRCVVVNVVDESPADKAGIKAGDVIMKINDTISERLNASEISKLMDNSEDNLIMTVNRLGDTIEVAVEKDIIVSQHVTYELINDNIAYINLDEFTGECANQIKLAIEDLQSQSSSLDGYIIDLRGNPGGYLESAQSFVGYFTGKNKLLTYIKFKDDSKQEYYTDTDKLIADDSKIVILVNSASASASELFAGTLQDLLGDRVKIVGTNTFGKGIAQDMFRFSDGSMIRYTIGEYFTSKGRKVHGIGINPDIEVYNSLKSDTDEQYDMAVKTIEEMVGK